MTTTDPKQTRREAEAERLAASAAESSIMRSTSEGAPPHRFKLSFHGRGWVPDEGSGGLPRVAERHTVEIGLPFDFPAKPPEIRFLTPLFHPSVSSAGTVSIEDLGLEWDPELGCDVIAERLWDLIRGAVVPQAVDRQNAARRWFDRAGTAERIADTRPLRDRPDVAPTNIIRYRRKTTVYAPPETSRKGSRSEPRPSAPRHDRPRANVSDRRPPVNGDPGIVYLSESAAVRSGDEPGDSQGIVFLDERP